MKVIYVHPRDESYNFAIRQAMAQLPADATDDDITALATEIMKFYCGPLDYPSVVLH